MARSGVLAERAVTASGRDYARLIRGAYDIVWPVVFQRLTRRFEIKRGHPVCAASVTGLQPDCLDRFQDDVEAVLDDLLRNAKVPIHNLDGWISTRLNAATVNAHRRRRGERGALQRPRLPGWLAVKLEHDAWLTTLAVQMLVWVGVPTAAGARLWPLGAWAELRARATGDVRGGEPEAMADVETVLTAMRQVRKWYENFVERPLGRKQAPVLPAQYSYSEQESESLQLALIDRDEMDDARLADLASTAVAAIEAQLRRGADPRDAVQTVLRTVFGSGTGAEELDRVPRRGPGDAERVAAMLADPATIERITAAALDILRPQRS
ncbi:MAG: hypothetical protein QOE61_5458 [Micromonosporaceae bacterium]|jgi:hypothetical protein|nr:hypothetical protein [Micromonosporaceae bacterium]